MSRSWKARTVLALASGAALALSFPPAGWSHLAFAGLIPLVLAAEGARPREAFLAGWLAGLVYFTGVVWWVTVAVINYGYLPAPVGWAVLLLMTSVLALYPGLFALAAASASRLGSSSGLAGVLLLPAAWTALEWVRGNLSFLGFPWANLAYSQYLRLPFIQSASLAGPWGPGFLVAAANLGLLSAWRALRPGPRRRVEAAGALLAAGMVLGNVAWGWSRLRSPGPAGPALKVAVLQGNFPQGEKWDRGMRETTVRVYEDLSRRAAAAGADLLVWPESAVPFFLQTEAAYLERITGLAREVGRPVLLGAPAFEADPAGEAALRNRAYYLDGRGFVAGRYDKIHLVPFGEYVPMKWALPFIGKLVAEVGDFTPGTDYALFAADGERFGTVICYEIIFPDLVRRFVDRGATFMTNITNDAWYERTSASLQHFSQMVFRAVENGVPMARAANTGISGFVDARGRILEASPLFERGFWIAELRAGRGATFYARRGDVFAWACLAVLAVWAAAGLAGARRRRQGRPAGRFGR